MKNVSQIFETWDMGVFYGDRRAHGRVTVEPEWMLNLLTFMGGTISQDVDPGRIGPWRYYQTTDGPLTDTIEVPNVKSIETDASIDTDAASCTITIYNQWMNEDNVPETVAGQLGNPGYFTYNRGNSADGQARWNQTANSWNNILVPMALIRTYQGYGGFDTNNQPLPLQDAVDGGFLTITGTWLVDAVTLGSDGMLTLKCRDACKLLIEQVIYPPLIPASLKALKYYRWNDTAFDSIWDPGAQLPPREVQNVPLQYANSSSDILSGVFNASVEGAVPTNSIDGNDVTAAIGHGRDSPDASNSVEWWEYNVNAEIDRIYVDPWSGGYTCYISVMEGGVWQGTEAIPFTPIPFSDLLGTYDDEIDAGVTWVVRTGVSYETPQWIGLPRVFNAQKVRVSFRDLKHTLFSNYPYRSGLFEVKAGNGGLGATGPGSLTNWSFAMASHYQNGYWVIDAYGTQFYFGQATALEQNSTVGFSTTVVAAQGHPSANGYWVLEQNGRVHSYGASLHFGDESNDSNIEGNFDFIDIACTFTGNGYWLLRRSGEIFAFGDAIDFGFMPELLDPTLKGAAICGHPTGMGYWAIDALGQVTAAGVAVEIGEVTEPRPANGVASAIECTASGNGYWIMWGNGQVFNYGDATNQGEPLGGAYAADGFGGIWWDVSRSRAESGYWTLRADGMVGAFGAEYFGRPGDNTTVRTDGNYKDYSTIIKDLVMWSGFTAYTPNPFGEGEIGIHGNIETTGAFSEQPLEEDVFDKKPVIDAITTIKEVVGYLFWVDEQGAVRFESPNWWAAGNWYEDGTRTTFIPEIDEAANLTTYSLTFDDDSLRSEVIITNNLPMLGNTGTITTRYTPPGQNLLRGMTKPAIWSNEVFSSAIEQQVMAEMIGVHIWFAQRQGSVQCVANPCIQINDQVRIFERVTGEAYIHYVRGKSTSMDLDTGVYTMQLTTHWLGSQDSWVIRAPGTTGSPTTQNEFLQISQQLHDYLSQTVLVT